MARLHTTRIASHSEFIVEVIPQNFVRSPRMLETWITTIKFKSYRCKLYLGDQGPPVSVVKRVAEYNLKSDIPVVYQGQIHRRNLEEYP